MKAKATESAWKEISLNDRAANRAAFRSWIHRETLASIFLLWECGIGWWFELRHRGRVETLAAAGSPEAPQPRAWADLFIDAERRLHSWPDENATAK